MDNATAALGHLTIQISVKTPDAQNFLVGRVGVTMIYTTPGTWIYELSNKVEEVIERESFHASHGKSVVVEQQYSSLLIRYLMNVLMIITQS